MITLAEVEKLGRVHTVEPVVLSVYLNVPRSPAQLPGLSARADELVAAAVRAAGRPGHLREEDRGSARGEAALAGSDWLGHPVAVFACAEVGLLEVVGLPEAPGMSPERAVLGTLAVPFDGLIPGYECGRCGALGLTADCCPDWGTAALPVPDLIEEMVSRTLEDGGEVLVLQDAPGGIAVRRPSR